MSNQAYFALTANCKKIGKNRIILTSKGKSFSVNKKVGKLFNKFSGGKLLSQTKLFRAIDPPLADYLEANEIIQNQKNAWKIDLIDGKKKIGLIGFPVSLNTFKSNPALGMFQVRRVFQSLISTNELARVVEDFGNVSLWLKNYERGIEPIREYEKKLQEIYEKNLLPITIGGDHIISYFSFSMCVKNHGSTKLALIHIDAHSDMYGVSKNSCSPLNHANYLGKLLMLPGFECFLIGVRDNFEIVDENAHIIDLEQTEGESILNFLPNNISYFLSLDIDVIDPVFAPNITFPSSMGYLPQKIKEIVGTILQHRKILGVDVVEVCNSKNDFSNTASIAAKLIYHIISKIDGKGDS